MKEETTPAVNLNPFAEVENELKSKKESFKPLPKKKKEKPTKIIPKKVRRKKRPAKDPQLRSKRSSFKPKVIRKKASSKHRVRRKKVSLPSTFFILQDGKLQPIKINWGVIKPIKKKGLSPSEKILMSLWNRNKDIFIK